MKGSIEIIDNIMLLALQDLERSLNYSEFDTWARLHHDYHDGTNHSLHHVYMFILR